MSSRTTRATEFSNLQDLIQPMDDGRWAARYDGFELHTALQPIFSLSHKRLVGYEALVRPFEGGSAVSPGRLFGRPRAQEEDIILDRLCRLLHLRNFSSIPDPVNWLFLNISPRTMADRTLMDSFFGNALKQLDFPSHRVVVEVVEQPSTDPQQLISTVEYYKSLGCLTAIDDFGAGHSNFERIWTLKPDIVKLDRSMLLRATEDHRTRHLLTGIVSLLHQAGCLVLMEGVETQDQAMMAIDSGVDFVQGFYFARPSFATEHNRKEYFELGQLLDAYKSQVNHQDDPKAQLRSHFEPVIKRVIEDLNRGKSLPEASRHCLAHGNVSRCYLLREDGLQIGTTLVSNHASKQVDLRYRPLENADCADWFRRHYLRRALSNPGSLQVTRPYLSVTDAHMCITLSLLFELNGEKMVFCCDLLSD